MSSISTPNPLGIRPRAGGRRHKPGTAARLHTRRAAGPVERALVFAIAAGAPIYLAFRGGGYDLPVHQEAGLVAWWLVAIGLLLGILPRARMAPRARRGLVAIALLACWTLIGMLWTGSLQRTFAEGARTLDYAGLAVLAWLSLSQRTFRIAGAGLAVAAVAVPLAALASRLWPAAFPDQEVIRIFGGDRLAYPLQYWNGIGCWCAMGTGLILSISAHERRRAIRALALASMPVLGLTLYLTYSRGSVGAAVIASVAALVWARHRFTVALHAVGSAAITGLLILVVRGEPAIANGTSGEGGGLVAIATAIACAACAMLAMRTRRAGFDDLRASLIRGRLALAALLASVVAGLAFAGSGDLGAGAGAASGAARASDPAARLENLDTSRVQAWESALRAFEHHPLGGLGAGTFEYWWIKDGTPGAQLRDAHSLYLQVLAEQGPLGLVFLMIFLAAPLALGMQGLRATRRSGEKGLIAGLLAAYVAFLFQAGIDWFWELPAVAVFGIGAGLVAAASTAGPRSGRVKLAVGRVVLILLAFMAAAVQVPGIISTERLRTGEDFLDAGFAGQAQHYAGQAIAAEPWSADAYAIRALAELSDGHLPAATKDARAAVDREPASIAQRKALLQVQFTAGDRRGALETLDAMENLDPHQAHVIASMQKVVRESAPP